MTVIPQPSRVAVAVPQPRDDPFYSYTGEQPLPSILPGTVLKTRSFPYHIFGFPTLLETVATGWPASV